MAIQTINIGNVVNDGLGDDLRTAFQKVNSNFSSLNSELAITAINTGTTGVGIFKQKDGATLQFKSLNAGKNIFLDEFDNYIEISAEVKDAFTKIHVDSGPAVDATIYPEITIEGMPSIGTDTHPGTTSGVQDIEVSSFGSSVQIRTKLPVTDILTTYDFGYLDSSFNNVVQFTLAWTNVDFGSYAYPSSISLDCGSFI